MTRRLGSRTRAVARVLRAAGRDRGSSSVEVVVLLPLVFLMIFAMVQGGLWFHARAVVLGAAQEGARVAAAESSSAGAGISAATSFIADAGSGVVINPAVTGSRSATTATVTVTGQAQSLVPFLNPSVAQSASFPTERITG
ncbi:TadE/TadG family type IV pilus assembly protein [Ornithinimicrobium sufpigmenti]|uniref:TadE/TadG family type IV pilus assembly protein n=1 Tax=Ornithinimicrobium sufpigmenti TaxID=2508882 RepID=UPI00103571E8|nr:MULTISPECIES: TadE/TadG family type IV pilus assembly protein [unclassified Ornithinimicrobium]